ncbi:MAG: hypothetical protein CMN56_13840 [Sneathiella sp.]|uniref:hypothetical protein n=1 Tax=Sneathiella sp. TaxID=1964365 RepID=UPI000C54C871|nr:hypothetical protein [Sneathiella sp.]MAZ04209.1 hypothetical protein [Sneathiella sp.]
MTDTYKYISNLTMPEKVSLFKELYNDIAGEGIDGDTELAHVNDFEVRMLKSMGGAGTVNEVTGLMEFKGGGSPPPAPANQTVTQTSEFPTELKPFVKDILGEARGEFRREKAEGYIPFQGPQLAAFTPEQQQAFATGRQQFGAQGLAGTPLGQASTYYQPALAATALGTSEIGTEDIQRRMDPFLQNVVDIAKREARRDEDIAQQGRAAQAVGAGSFGGSRQAIVEAEADRNLQRQLSDIQAAGLSTAFQNAQRAAEAQRAREMAGGRQFAGLGESAFQRARGDITGLAGVGEAQQARSQQALDIARREFEEEKAFPQTALQRYGSIIRGFPLTPSQQTVVSQREPLAPSLAQTLLGGIGTGVGLYGAFGGFKKAGGLVGLLGGGTPTTPLRPPYNLFSGPSSRVGVPQYQGGGSLGVNLGGGYASGAIGGANTPAPVTSPTAPTANDLNSILEELRKRKLIGRSAGGLAGLTVSRHQEGKQPSLGRRIMGNIKDWYEDPFWEEYDLTLGDIKNWYVTPTGESDITSLTDPRYPWNIEANVTHKDPFMLDPGGSNNVEDPYEYDPEAMDRVLREQLNIVTPAEADRLRNPEYRAELKEKRKQQDREQKQAALTQEAEERRLKAATQTLSGLAPEVEKSPTDPTDPASDPDAPLTYIQQLQKLMADQATSSSKAITKAGEAEQKYLDYLKSYAGGDQDKWTALVDWGRRTMAETPQYEGESVVNIAARTGEKPLEALQAAQTTDKALGFKIAEAEKDMAVRRAALETAGLQQSFDNRIALIGAQSDAAAAQLKMYEGLDNVTDPQVRRVGSLVRSELNKLSAMEPDALQNLTEKMKIEGLTAETFDVFKDIIGKRIKEGNNKFRENDYVNHIALLAQEIYAKQSGADKSYPQAVMQATNDFIKGNDILRVRGWFSREENQLGLSGK